MNCYDNYTDEQLFALLKEHDETAFNVLFQRYRSRLYYYILRHTKSAVIAEEIVIDIFMKLWKGRELAAHIAEPAAFFHKIAYYKAMDFLRTTARRSRLAQAYVERMEKAEERSPADLLIDEEERKLLLNAINQLPPQRKLIYQMSRHEGLSHDEIAQALNLSKSTVNNTIISATHSITQYLKNNIAGAATFPTVFIFL